MSRLLLARHGQASFGAADYDNLSDLGHEQSRILGAALAARGVTADLVVAGQMKRHDQTARGVLEGAGWASDIAVDAGWNELDHTQVLDVHAPPRTASTSGEDEDEKAAFQRWFEDATRRWTSGADETSYDESFVAFGARVDAALARLVADLPPSGTAVVLTSGGAIAWTAATLLADEPAVRSELWLRINPVSVNSGVTTLVRGRRGTTLVAFNAHDHLSPDLITYR